MYCRTQTFIWQYKLGYSTKDINKLQASQMYFFLRKGLYKDGKNY
jgi:hypothetical protein